MEGRKRDGFHTQSGEESEKKAKRRDTEDAEKRGDGGDALRIIRSG